MSSWMFNEDEDNVSDVLDSTCCELWPRISNMVSDFDLRLKNTLEKKEKVAQSERRCHWLTVEFCVW